MVCAWLNYLYIESFESHSLGLNEYVSCRLSKTVIVSLLELLSNHQISSIRYNSIESIEFESFYLGIEFISNPKAQFHRIFDDLIRFSRCSIM
jgi:hypothetical protein